MKRKTLNLLMLFLLGVSLSANAQKKSEKVSWLLVLNAEKGTVVKCSNDATKKCLQLTGVHKTVAAFSDRPNRKYRSIPTDKMVKAWKKVFKKSAPNAAILHPDLKNNGKDDVHIVTIEKVKMGKKNNITMELSYVGDDPLELNKSHNNISLFIDSVYVNSGNQECCLDMVMDCCLRQY